MHDGTGVVPVATTDGAFSSFTLLPSINAGGVVAFLAYFDAGGSGVFKAAAGQDPVPVATTGGAFSGISISTPINAGGTVAFAANLVTGGQGIFIGPDPVADRVIGTCDALFGSTVSGLTFPQEALNDAGQVTFGYTLANGHSGIAIAGVPEPAALPLIAAAAAAAVTRSRRRPQAS